ncbi:MAG: hypothetical protein K0S46_1891 [Moraxellaceae bacterium]|nr:hypothetical protein [Moraxellaceae bacterium]
MFSEINRSRGKFYLANALTLSIYGCVFIIVRAGGIGRLVGANFPGPGMGFLLTLLTFGVYPNVMLSMLAYKLAPDVYPPLGHIVLALNLAALIAALLSGGLFIVVSMVLLTHAAWLVADAADILAIEKAPKHSLNADAAP